MTGSPGQGGQEHAQDGQYHQDDDQQGEKFDQRSSAGRKGAVGERAEDDVAAKRTTVHFFSYRLFAGGTNADEIVKLQGFVTRFDVFFVRIVHAVVKVIVINHFE